MQLAFPIEDEDVGRGLGSVGLGDLLGLAVVEIREIEVAVFGADLHVFEAVGDVGVAQLGEGDGLGVVGIDGDEAHAFGAVVVDEFLHTAFVKLRSGAVIADEHDDEDGVLVVGQLVNFVVDAGEGKVGGRGADGQGGMRLVGLRREAGLLAERRERDEHRREDGQGASKLVKHSKTPSSLISPSHE